MTTSNKNSSAFDLERDRFALERERTQFEQQLARDRFELEKNQSKLDGGRLELEKEKARVDKRFLNKYFGTIITAIVSLAAVFVSAAQIQVARITSNAELENTRVQKEEERNAGREQHTNEMALLKEKQGQEWNLSLARFFADHKKEVFGGRKSEREAILRILILTFPKDIVDAATREDPQIANTIKTIRQALKDNPNMLERNITGLGTVSYTTVGEGDIRVVKFSPKWERENIIDVALPQLIGVQNFPANGFIKFNKSAEGALKAAFAEIESKGLKDRILSWDEGYNPITEKRKRHILTKHAVGLAFDINEKWNPPRKPAPEGEEGSVAELVPIFRSHGFVWSKGDPAHFFWTGRPRSAIVDR